MTLPDFAGMARAQATALWKAAMQHYHGDLGPGSWDRVVEEILVPLLRTAYADGMEAAAGVAVDVQEQVKRITNRHESIGAEKVAEAVIRELRQLAARVRTGQAETK